MKEAIISGTGTYPVVGSYERRAVHFDDLGQRGLDGMAIGLVNNVAVFPLPRDEILPHVEQLGLREPASG